MPTNPIPASNTRTVEACSNLSKCPTDVYITVGGHGQCGRITIWPTAVFSQWIPCASIELGNRKTAALTLSNGAEPTADKYFATAVNDQRIDINVIGHKIAPYSALQSGYATLVLGYFAIDI